jgi:hypothetical protein
MIPISMSTDLYSAVAFSLRTLSYAGHRPGSNRDEQGGYSSDPGTDDLDTESVGDDEGIGPESGGMTGSSDGAPYEATGETPDEPNASVDTGTGYGDVDIGALFGGYVDAMHAVVADKIGEGGPMWLIPTELLHDLGEAAGVPDYDY